MVVSHRPWDRSSGLEDRCLVGKCIAQSLLEGVGILCSNSASGDVNLRACVQMSVTPWIQLALRHLHGGLLPLSCAGAAIIVRSLACSRSRKQEFWCLFSMWFFLNIYLLGHTQQCVSKGIIGLSHLLQTLSHWVIFSFKLGPPSCVTCYACLLQMARVSALNSHHLAAGLATMTMLYNDIHYNQCLFSSICSVICSISFTMTVREMLL